MSSSVPADSSATEGPHFNSFTSNPRLLFCGPACKDHLNLQLLNKANICAVDIHSVKELSQAVSATAPDLIVLDLDTLRRVLANEILPSNSAEDLEYALFGLHARHADIVRMIAKGLRNREIATSLGLSSRTVKAILSSLYLRYDVTNRTELLGLLMEQGHLAAAQAHPKLTADREARQKPKP